MLVLTLVDQPGIERAAGTFLKQRVEHEVGARLPGDTPEVFVDRVLGAMPGQAREVTVVRGDRLGAASAAVTGAYRRLLGALVHELRVVAGCTFGLFALTALLALSSRRRAAHLLVPAGILAAATGLALVGYLLGQSWAWAFLTGRYLGFWYLAVVGVVAALLADVAWNRARVSAAIARALWDVPPP